MPVAWRAPVIVLAWPCTTRGGQGEMVLDSPLAIGKRN